MKKKNKLLRNQNGSISMFVIVSVLFLTFVLIGIYTSYANKLKAQEEQLGKIQGNYGEHASEDGMDKLYIAQTQPEDDNDDEETGDSDTTLLPAEYQQVEYIQSTGTQYIDTGFIPNNNTNVEIQFELKSLFTDSSSNIGIVGTRTNATSNAYTLICGGENKLYSGYGTTNERTTFEFEKNTVYTMNKEENTTIVNDATITTASSQSFTSPYALVIFAVRNGKLAPEFYSKMKLYYCKIYDNGNLVRDFVPCYRKSDNVIGMYDIVNNVFYTNSGSGTFTKGNDV